MTARFLTGVAVLTAAISSGCGTTPKPAPAKTSVDQTLFAPQAMRLHPVFTQIRDWTGDGKSDGIEAVVEIQDPLGDPIKAAGRIIFELYAFRPQSPDPRGARLVNPWEGRLDSMEDQRLRWNRVNRAYIFQLAWAQIDPSQSYVLTASLELSGGGRFVDRTILQAQRDKPAPTPGPTTIPSGVSSGVSAGGSIITTVPTMTSPTVSTAKSPTTSTRNQEPSSVPTSSHQPPARIDQP